MNKSAISRVKAIVSSTGFTAERITAAVLLLICIAAVVLV